MVFPQLEIPLLIPSCLSIIFWLT